MALTPRRVTKKSAKQEHRLVGKERKILPCKECGEDVPNLGADIAAITCGNCCIRMSAPPDLPAKPKPPEERNPRGWQFMKEYRAPDGTLYHRGVKVDEEISKEPVSRPKRVSKRTTDSTTTKSRDNSGHPKRTNGKSTTTAGTRKSKSISNKATKSTVRPIRSTNTAAKPGVKKVVKRKGSRPAV